MWLPSLRISPLVCHSFTDGNGTLAFLCYPGKQQPSLCTPGHGVQRCCNANSCPCEENIIYRQVWPKVLATGKITDLWTNYMQICSNNFKKLFFSKRVNAPRSEKSTSPILRGERGKCQIRKWWFLFHHTRNIWMVLLGIQYHGHKLFGNIMWVEMLAFQVLGPEFRALE